MTGTIRASKGRCGRRCQGLRCQVPLGDAKCRSAKKRRDREHARELKHFARSEALCDEEREEEVWMEEEAARDLAVDDGHRILLIKRQMRSTLLELEPSNRDPLVQARNRQLIETMKSLEETLTMLEEEWCAHVLASKPHGAHNARALLGAVRRRAADMKQKIRLLDAHRSSSDDDDVSCQQVE